MTEPRQDTATAAPASQAAWCVIAAGVVVVAAMGNEHDEGNPTEYPAAIREVCAVGATDELDKRAGFLPAW